MPKMASGSKKEASLYKLVATFLLVISLGTVVVLNQNVTQLFSQAAGKNSLIKDLQTNEWFNAWLDARLSLTKDQVSGEPLASLTFHLTDYRYNGKDQFKYPQIFAKRRGLSLPKGQRSDFIFTKDNKPSTKWGNSTNYDSEAILANFRNLQKSEVQSSNGNRECVDLYRLESRKTNSYLATFCYDLIYRSQSVPFQCTEGADRSCSLSVGINTKISGFKLTDGTEEVALGALSPLFNVNETVLGKDANNDTHWRNTYFMISNPAAVKDVQYVTYPMIDDEMVMVPLEEYLKKAWCSEYPNPLGVGGVGRLITWDEHPTAFAPEGVVAALGASGSRSNYLSFNRQDDLHCYFFTQTPGIYTQWIRLDSNTDLSTWKKQGIKVEPFDRMSPGGRDACFKRATITCPNGEKRYPSAREAGGSVCLSQSSWESAAPRYCK